MARYDAVDCLALFGFSLDCPVVPYNGYNKQCLQLKGDEDALIWFSYYRLICYLSAMQPITSSSFDASVRTIVTTI